MALPRANTDREAPTWPACLRARQRPTARAGGRPAARRGTAPRHPRLSGVGSAAQLGQELGPIFRENRGHAGMGGLAQSLCCLGWCRQLSGKLAEAERCHQEVLSAAREHGAPLPIARCIQGLASVAAAAGDAEQAARLLGAAAAIRDRIGVPLPEPERTDIEQASETARVVLGVRPSRASTSRVEHSTWASWPYQACERGRRDTATAPTRRSGSSTRTWPASPCPTRGGRRVPPVAGRRRAAPLLSCTRNGHPSENRRRAPTCWSFVD
jgi:hypothetical protein